MERRCGHAFGACSADREATCFPFGLRRPPTLACSGFASRLRLRVRARRSGRVRRRSACRRYGLRPLRFGNGGARLMLAATRLATARRARLSRSACLRSLTLRVGHLRPTSAHSQPPPNGTASGGRVSIRMRSRNKKARLDSLATSRRCVVSHGCRLPDLQKKRV